MSSRSVMAASIGKTILRQRCPPLTRKRRSRIARSKPRTTKFANLISGFAAHQRCSLAGLIRRGLNDLPHDLWRERDDELSRKRRCWSVDDCFVRSFLLPRCFGRYEMTTEHKWLDPECGDKGCQSLVLKKCNDDFVKAVSSLVIAARTSGGVAGRDETLCKALDDVEAFYPAIRGTK